MARFYKGQPVICVKGGSNPNADRRYPGLRWPVKGQRYTIREAEVPQRGRYTFVLVVGIRNRIIRWPCGTRYEAGFWEDRFEPATDISELDTVRTTVERYMGDALDHEDEPDDHPTAPRKKETVE